MRTRRARSRLNDCTGTALLFLLCVIFSPAMLYLGISSINDENRLRSSGVVTTAEVTDWSGNQEEAKEPCVQYRFSIDHGKTWYTCSDRTGRRDICCPITEEHWQTIRETKRLEVLYLPDNPWINRPVHGTISIFNSWAGVCMGILPWLLCLLGWLTKKHNG